MKRNRFSHLEVVKLSRLPDALAAYDGTLGTVLGVSEGEDTYFYAVQVDDDQTIMIPESSATSTGKIRKRAEVYGGESIKVTVDQDGYGSVVKNEAKDR